MRGNRSALVLRLATTWLVLALFLLAGRADAQQLVGVELTAGRDGSARLTLAFSGDAPRYRLVGRGALALAVELASVNAVTARPPQRRMNRARSQAILAMERRLRSCVQEGGRVIDVYTSNRPGVVRWTFHRVTGPVSVRALIGPLQLLRR